MNEIEVSGRMYRIGKMNVMTQFHVTRRLGPALVICGVTFKMMLDGARVSLDDWAAVAGPVMEVVSQMTDIDVEYVLHACLRSVERKDPGSGLWAPVTTPDNILMFQDIEMAEMLRLTVEVLRVNLTNFAKGLTAGGNSSENSGAGQT